MLALTLALISLKPWTWTLPAPRIASTHANSENTQSVLADSMSIDSVTAQSSPVSDTGTPVLPQQEVPVPAIESVPTMWVAPPQMEHLILANKGTKQLYLLARQGQSWSIEKTYPMAIGEIMGRKERQGDKKTPEGRYFIVGRREGNELPEIYGPLAYVLNYPNEDDRKAGRTGTGIWIHGTSPDTLPLQTRGCIELDNRNLAELGRTLRAGIGVPVVIVNKSKIDNPAGYPDFAEIEILRNRVTMAYNDRQMQFARFLGNWEQAWESMNIDQYSQFYDSARFRSQGMDWDAWRTRKAATFQMYSKILVDVDKMLLTNFTESTAVVKFLQRYESDKIQVSNGKMLLLDNVDGKWKIYQESSFSVEDHLL